MAMHFALLPSYPSQRGCSHPVPRAVIWGLWGPSQGSSLSLQGAFWEPEPTGQISTLSTLQEWDCLDQGTLVSAVHAGLPSQQGPKEMNHFEYSGSSSPSPSPLLGFMTVHLGVADLPPQCTDFGPLFSKFSLTIDVSIMFSGSSVWCVKSYQDWARWLELPFYRAWSGCTGVPDQHSLVGHALLGGSQPSETNHLGILDLSGYLPD